jgi:hypothetical protein
VGLGTAPRTACGAGGAPSAAEQQPHDQRAASLARESASATVKVQVEQQQARTRAVAE